MPAPAPLLIVLSAPSGGGKTTLCEQLLAADPRVARVVTCTTRVPRGAERDGVDYHFLGAAAFERRVREGDFLEHATVYGNHYGTLRQSVADLLATGRDVLLAIDVQGAATVRARAREDARLRVALVTVFLTPATADVLAQRLRKRGADTPDAVATRLRQAQQEVAHWREFDYLLPSTTVAEDLRQMQCVLEAERRRTSRASAPELDPS
jgi:guanylate kinase